MPEVTRSLDRAGLRVIDVLLVEDDPGDVLMTTEAFEMSPVHSTLHVVGDGEQALSGAGPAFYWPRPPATRRSPRGALGGATVDRRLDQAEDRAGSAGRCSSCRR